MTRIAQLISILLGVPWVFVIVWLLIFQTGLSQSQITLFSILLPILHIALPMMFFVWAFHEGMISDIDITKRKQRFGIMSLMLANQLISLGFIHVLGSPAMFQYAMAITLVYVATFVVTLFWKISLHMTLNVIGFILLNHVYNWEYIYLLPLLPLVFWSRLYLKKHTFMQLVAGTLVSASIMLVGLRVL